MRTTLVVVLVIISISLAGCRGSDPYTQQDLRQVDQTYAQLHPMYLSFKRAFGAGDTAGILAAFRNEHAPCAVVDQIDNRDTIDPNVALFQASIALDDMCNAIESGYAEWAIQHHKSYPQGIQPLRPEEIFVGADSDLEKINRYLKHPSALA